MARPSFAEALKEARLAAGLSQSELARRAGLTGSYISVLESQRRPPPRPRVIKALCKTLGISPKPLLEAAALERSPPTVRRRLERMRRERGRVEKTRDRLLTTTLFQLAHRPRVVEPMAEFMGLPAGQQALLGRLLGRVRKVRTIDEAESKSDEILEDASAAERDALIRVLPRVLVGEEGAPSRQAADSDERPPAWAAVPVCPTLAKPGEVDGEIPVETEIWHPRLFFWRVAGDRAHPRIEAGDLVLVDPDRTPQEGDVVVVTHDGEDVVGSYQRRAREILISSPRPELPPLRLPARGFRARGVVIRLVREL